MRSVRLFLTLICPLVLCSCASSVHLQPTVNSLAISGRFDQALSYLDDPQKYGKNNELLLFLDKGLVLHLSGQYEKSIEAFDQAKLKFDQLYTQSISKIAASWLWNDYALPYRGEDFERVMINVFQSLNYAALGEFNEAVVEARDVDSILNAINDQYPSDKKNVYREDAFARLLMGILYEASGKLNDAKISYIKSFECYRDDFSRRYSLQVPQLLKENLLAAAEYYGGSDLRAYKEEFPDTTFSSIAEKEKQAEVYLIEYAGLSPVKISTQIPIPLPGGVISQVSFPAYRPRFFDGEQTLVTAATEGGALSYSSATERGEDISRIAIKNLEDRKLRVMAKAVLRPAGKYFAERALADQVGREHGEDAENVVKIVGTLFNIFSEQADLRSWQTLPAEIRIARLLLDPGEYEITVDDRENVGKVLLQAGEKKFFIVRTVK